MIEVKVLWLDTLILQIEKQFVHLQTDSAQLKCLFLCFPR